MNDTVRVLVPLDGSEMAEAALSYITTLRGLGPLHVRLVAVVEEARHYGLPDPDEWERRQVRVLEQYVEAKKRALQQEHPELQVEAAVRQGNPADMLLKDAGQFGAGYVVMSTHGRSGAERWRFGSVADKVIRAGEWNTLIVGPQPATWPTHYPVRSIMVPLDGSRRAEEALPVAAAIAAERGAQVHLVRVVEKPLRFEDPTGSVLRGMEEGARSYLETKAAAMPDAEPHTFLLTGSPTADALRAYVQVQAMDLVVLTSHGHGGLIRATLGSVADRLIGGAAPVLVLRSKA